MIPALLLISVLFLSSAHSDTLDTQWMIALLQGKKVGHLHTVRRSCGDTIITDLFFGLQLMRGATVAVTSHEKVRTWETSNGKPLAFEQERATGKAVRRISGKIINGGKTLRLSTEAGGTAESREIPWPDSAVLYEGARRMTAALPPREGLNIGYTSFSYDVIGFERVSVTVGARTEVALLGTPALLYRIEKTTDVGGTRVLETSFIDTNWTEKRCSLDLGALKMELIDCSRETALARNDQFDIMGSVTVKAPAGSGNVAAARSCTYEFIVPGGIVLPQSDEQTVSAGDGEVVRVKVTRLDRNAGPPSSPTGTVPDMRRFLQPSRHIESDAPGIVTLARKTVKNRDNQHNTALKIRDFARSYIKSKSLDVGFASAREVLNLKEGDCTEHAVFTAALCRAAGIPARVAVGIVRPPWSSMFFYHAWTQVFVNGRWISVDSALGDFHPGYVALAYDAEESTFLSLGKSMGTLAIRSIQCDQ